MLKTYEREKFINVVVYFGHRAKHCGRSKLYRLLFLLDFEHFKQTGRSVTGLDYYALGEGALPLAIDREIEGGLSADFAAAVEVIRFGRLDADSWLVKSKTAFDASHFSKRELRLLEEIASKYREASAPQMAEVMQAENEILDRARINGIGQHKVIPYELCVEGENAPLLIEKVKEFSAIKKHYASK
jgi:hypothetical protein